MGSNSVWKRITGGVHIEKPYVGQAVAYRRISTFPDTDFAHLIIGESGGELEIVEFPGHSSQELGRMSKGLYGDYTPRCEKRPRKLRIDPSKCANHTVPYCVCGAEEFTEAEKRRFLSQKFVKQALKSLEVEVTA